MPRFLFTSITALALLIVTSSASAQDLQLTVEYLEFEFGDKEKSKLARALTAIDFLKVFSDKQVETPVASSQADRVEQLRKTAKTKRQFVLQKSVTVAREFELNERQAGLSFHAAGMITRTLPGQLRTRFTWRCGETEQDANQTSTVLDLTPGQTFVVSGMEEERVAGGAIHRTAKYVVVRVDETQ